MPNFIHSLDAANVHLLLANISELNLPVFTVHDCFAATPNNLYTLEKLVKEAFINIYFKDEGYLLKLHKHFVDTIISASEPIDCINDIDKKVLPHPENLNNKDLEDKKIYVIDRKTFSK